MFEDKRDHARRVLIVEDERLIGMSLKDSFERSGAHALWVQTDSAAYIALDARQGGFDLLILDVDLGRGTTGFDVARYARRLNDTVGIIISSGSPPDCLKTSGVNGAVFVPKPCTEAAMLAAADMVCRAPRGAQVAA